MRRENIGMPRHIAPFVFGGLVSRVVFGAGALAQAGAEIARLGRGRALVLSTPEQEGAAARLAEALGPLAAGVFAGARMHTPVSVTAEAVAAFGNAGADCVVSLGGGSTIGLGKAIALRTGCDQVAIPTTYAGSEMTDILGETERGEKTTRRDPAIRPEVVIYDVSLSRGLPLALSIASGMNALAHAAEALYAEDGNPIVALMAGEAVGALAQALPLIAAEPHDERGRGLALYGAWLGGASLGAASMALHHKLCHVLGGAFALPHAETHAAMLPHTLGFNAPAAREALAPLRTAFGEAVGPGLWDWAKRIGAPMNLADLGLRRGDLDRAADLAVAKPYPNPRPFGRAEVRAILQEAWDGARPDG